MQATTVHDIQAVRQQLAEVRSLQSRIRSVILDDSLEQLEAMMDEKRSRLASLRIDRLSGSEASAISRELQGIWETEAALEQLVRDRMMLMRTQLRKASETGRALRGYGRGSEGPPPIERHSRDIQV
jgi:hypothetical protein